MVRMAVKVGIAGVLLLAASALGDTLSVQVGATASITGTVQGETRSRILLNIPLPESIASARIDRALMTAPSLDSGVLSLPMTVEARTVTTAWEPGSVTWSVPWQSPGADYDTLSLGRYVVWPGDAHPFVLDITDAVRSWSSGAGAYGILLKQPDDEGAGFGTEASVIEGAFSQASVKLFFSPE
jgi:hypothetical protein